MIAKKVKSLLKGLYLRLYETAAVQSNWPMVSREILQMALRAPGMRLALY
jgi:hypothetical protein